MFLFDDIDSSIEDKLNLQGYDELEFEEKKHLIEKELKLYILKKLSIMNIPTDILRECADKSLESCFNILAIRIPQTCQSQLLEHFVYFLLKVASSMQGSEIVWIKGQIDVPLINYSETSGWISIATDENPDYMTLFAFIWNFFLNNFTVTPKVLKFKPIPTEKTI